MNIKVNIISQNKIKNINIDYNSKVIDLLKKINLKPDIVIVLRDNTPIPVDEQLENNEKISIIEVSSGG